MKKTALLKKILITLLVLLALSASTLYYLFIMKPFQEMRALNHSKLSPEAFAAAIDPNAEGNKPYKAPQSTIDTEINLVIPYLKDEQDIIVSIDSSKISSPVYLGPYKKQITIKADEELFSIRGRG